MKIFFIGMPGSGKTTVAKQIATALGLPFVDLDEEIVSAAGQSIPEIFQQKGEVYFRQLESDTLKQWAADEKSFVMATGGGAPCFYDGINIINQVGLSIFLNVPIPILAERVSSNKERPLLATNDVKEIENRLTKLFEDRIDCYGQAKLVFEKPNISDILQQIRLQNKSASN